MMLVRVSPALMAASLVLFGAAQPSADAVDAAGPDRGPAAGGSMVSPKASGITEQPAPCAHLVPPAIQAAGTDHSAGRTATPEDLLQLRDFGAQGVDLASPGGFSVSPDGRSIAVEIRQANAKRNVYCVATLVYSIDRPNDPPRIIAQGGDLIRDTISLYGLEHFPTGMPTPLTPSWSPDGRWIAFLRSDHGRTNLWVGSSDGHILKRLTDTPVDVDGFRWNTAVRTIRFWRDDARTDDQAAIDREGLSGFRYGDRFWPLLSARPYVTRAARPSYYVATFDADGGGIRIGTNVEPDPAADSLTDAQPTASDDHGVMRGWATADGIHLRIDGHDIACTVEQCTRPIAIWWDVTGKQLLFLRSEGFANSGLTLYRWDGGRPPVPVLSTPDMLFGCVLSHGRLYCAHETSDAPRDIVSIDLATGDMRSLIDTNPEWHSLRLGTSTRLQVTNRFGLPSFGDLVLPPEHREGEKHPLVIVQYDSRGFLRGGTGDEYPIQALAAAGFAVLSVSRPTEYDAWQARHHARPARAAIGRWMDRRSVHDALIDLVRKAASTGSVDISRVAITGLSDGASTATYALLHSRIFKTAILSTCCEDPRFTRSGIGSRFDDFTDHLGFPTPWEKWTRSWRNVSLSWNAGRICTPLLIEASDAEFRMALSTYEAWRSHGRQVTMYVYPDEFHIKWQPAHRLAIYERNLSWLRQWRDGPAPSCKLSGASQMNPNVSASMPATPRRRTTSEALRRIAR